MLVNKNKITVAGFKRIFKKIIAEKEKVGIRAIQNNPGDLLRRAKAYGNHFKNGSWGWNSNIWNRSASGSVVIEKESDLEPEHKELMLRVLEHILCQPMIQVDANMGSPGSKSKMRCRLYCDPQFPDIAYRWRNLNFPGNPKNKPDVELFCIPHYLENPNVPGRGEMLRVLRFPNHNYSIVTCSSYQGEVKKGFLSHWIYHVFKKGGTGEHASLKEFTVKKADGKEKKITMCVWGLTGSGKSTHGMYIIDKKIGKAFKRKFGIDISKFVRRQVIKNDDIVAIFKNRVFGPERGSWTKTEDVDASQIGIYRAAVSKRALHENTEWNSLGNVSFKGKILQYHGRLNQNARTVLFFDDTGFFDGNVNSTQGLNMAVFISPGYLSDYAWLKINDTSFAAKVLADGRTTGHPAQSRTGIGEEKYVARYCLPFTMGAGCAAHVRRFYKFLNLRKNTPDPIDIYQINTTGRIGAKYEWSKQAFGNKWATLPKPRFKNEGGKSRPVGGTGPSIEETELFLVQAARGAVDYKPHPIWGEKVLVPVRVEGISAKRLRELDPFTYRSNKEMRRLLKAQIFKSKFYLDRQCKGLPKYIYNAMDF